MKKIMIMVAMILAFAVPVKAAPSDYSEQELFERVVEAEAGNQGLQGKRYVAAVVYNRVASDRFPNTIYEVLVAPGQFSTVWNGAVKHVQVSDETREAIALEVSERSDAEIMYFNNGPCSGRYAFTYGEHRFGK